MPGKRVPRLSQLLTRGRERVSAGMREDANDPRAPHPVRAGFAAVRRGRSKARARPERGWEARTPRPAFPAAAWDHGRCRQRVAVRVHGAACCGRRANLPANPLALVLWILRVILPLILLLILLLRRRARAIGGAARRRIRSER